MAASSCAVADLSFDADETLRWYAPAASDVAYGFCERCGASLFWRAESEPERISVCAGTLDPPTGLRTIRTLFAESVSDYHELDTSVETRARD